MIVRIVRSEIGYEIKVLPFTRRRTGIYTLLIQYQCALSCQSPTGRGTGAGADLVLARHLYSETAVSDWLLLKTTVELVLVYVDDVIVVGPGVVKHAGQRHTTRHAA